MRVLTLYKSLQIYLNSANFAISKPMHGEAYFL